MNIQAAMVRSILERWQAYEWTVQGFGFIRTKLADVGRIHVWDSRLATPLVSTMHTHPWPLKSTIISGELINMRFVVVEPHHPGMPYEHSRIATGEGGGLIGERSVRRVFPVDDPEFYTAGHSYEQRPDEIHRTIAQDGTVTLLERPQGPPLEEASVFWPVGTEWVSAEPKPADTWQVGMAVQYALQRWNAETAGKRLIA
jgi:hypothetical protein